MTRSRATGALVLLLLGAAVVFAQEQRRLENILITDRFELGTAVPFRMEGTTADAFEFEIRIDPTIDILWQLPTADGAAGEQLQTDGAPSGETLTWASAGSSRVNKNIDGRIDPAEALRTVLGTPIYRFHYKPGAEQSTKDYATGYVGPMAEESPWAMHHDGKILNPITTVGVPIAAIQAQQAQIDVLKAEIAALKAAR